MIFAKICSPWREMLIRPYKVLEGQLDSVARRMSFLKDKLKDWCYQASIQKNMKRLRATIKRTPLCCDNNDFPTITVESKENQGSQGRGKSRTTTPTLGVPDEPLSGKDQGDPNPRPKPTNLGKGPDQQRLHPKDLDEQIQDPMDEPLQQELSDEPIPELMKVSKTVTVGLAEQKVTYLPTTHRNMVNYANLKPRMIFLMQSITAIWYQFINSRTFLQTKASIRKKWRLIRMDLQPNQNNYNEGDKLQTSESLSGFFSRMAVSNKTMERIM
ncbi:UNVERIFIED_CONTAM: hypothetical protein Sradi_2348900 [Sesamum radiatum]|uniref:Uncharacterized protein n=1 Tax=Sesamum radiatum TaxID=300843 RepID=A0AAW2T5C6_SESRA